MMKVDRLTDHLDFFLQSCAGKPRAPSGYRFRIFSKKHRRNGAAAGRISDAHLSGSKDLISILNLFLRGMDSRFQSADRLFRDIAGSFAIFLVPYAILQLWIQVSCATPMS